jgi:rRNA processing protein Gar1
MSWFDEFADVTGAMIEDYADLALDDIQSELLIMHEMADRGEAIDEKRFDLLIKLQEEHPEFQRMLAEEREHWKESIAEFIEHCLERTRSFIPVNVFDTTYEDLVNLGLSSDLSRRILQRQCLWLVRMSREEIARLHESDLMGRFSSLQQNLDIIETAAIYAALPEEFINDTKERKTEWKNSIEDNLRQMLIDHDNDELPPHRIRCPAYDGKQYGPIRDVTSTRPFQVIKGDMGLVQKNSFIELCRTNFVMARMNRSLKKLSSDAYESNNHIGITVSDVSTPAKGSSSSSSETSSTTTSTESGISSSGGEFVGKVRSVSNYNIHDKEKTIHVEVDETADFED